MIKDLRNSRGFVKLQEKCKRDDMNMSLNTVDFSQSFKVFFSEFWK